MKKRIVAAVLTLLFLIASAAGLAYGDTAATVTIRDEANIRAGAGTSFSVLQVGHKGDRFEVVGSAKDASDRTWYKINIGSAMGFVAGWLVTYTAAVVTPKQPAPAVTQTAVASNRYAVAIEDGTSLRTGPGTNFERIATIKAGTSLPILAQAKAADGKTWFKLNCSSLKLKQTSAYVASWVVTVKTVTTSPTLPSTFTASALVNLWKVKLQKASRTIDTTNLRQGPSVLSSRLGTLPSGTNVAISGYALNDQKETWCRVVAGSTTGWIYAPLLSTWDAIPAGVVDAAVGRTLVSISASAAVTDIPFGAGPWDQLPAKGTVITGVATDGKVVYLELPAAAPAGRWMAMTEGTVVGGTAMGARTCSLSRIEAVSSNGWTGITIHVDGDKTGLSITHEHSPERIEVSLPSLVQSGQGGTTGVPTRQVSAINVWTTSTGFVSKIVIYLSSPDMTVRQSLAASTIQLVLSAPGSAAPSKAVFLQDELLSGSEETFFADNATFLPLVDVANAYGILLSWDAANQQTGLTLGDRQYVLKDGLRTLKVAQGDNHWNEDMAAAPRLVGGLLYVPVSTVAHILSLEVSGDALRVYLDPVILSIALTGAVEQAPGSVTLTSMSSLKVTKAADGDGYTRIRFNGVLSGGAGSQSLAPWLSVAKADRRNDVEPEVTLRIHAPVATLDIQNPATGVYIISAAKGRAGRLEGKKIVVDPGHGYVMPNGTVDMGASGPTGTSEASINLAIALKVKTLLQADGAIVILTRTDDSSKDNPDLAGRVQIANGSGGNLFVSIHENATDAGFTAGGTETHYWFDQSRSFAELLQKRLIAGLQTKDLGVDKSSLYLISHIDTMPAVLVECAFISNPDEERLLREESFQQKAASAIESTIVEYFVK